VVRDATGHTRGHVAYHFPAERMLFSADSLLAAGCGRLFEGTPRQMHDSLTRLSRLPDDTRVYCGHEYTLSNIRFARAAEPENRLLPELEARMQALRDRDQPTLPSTIGQEKATNPFMRVGEPSVARNASSRAAKKLSDPVSVLAEIRDWKNNF
jgi:hydroxyacylglutathione hydrolase